MEEVLTAEPDVSIIIPVLHDTVALAGLLASVETGARTEIIVVSGAPPDGQLRALQGRYPAVRWMSGAPGRGAQMDLGAEQARGRWLLFLHADTRLGSGWTEEIRRAGADPRIVGGSFRFALDSPARPARLIERAVAWRVRWLQLPYGDQALFVRRSAFRRVGGYRQLPLMEDIDLVRRLRRVGRLTRSAVPAVSSARRWEQRGWIRGTLENLVLVLLYFSGVSPERLVRWYYRRLGGASRVSGIA